MYHQEQAFLVWHADFSAQLFWVEAWRGELDKTCNLMLSRLFWDGHLVTLVEVLHAMENNFVELLAAASHRYSTASN